MERLPTEMLDHIVSYVKDRKSLVALRLVDKAFCRSASRALFRFVVLQEDDRRSMRKFEALSSSEYAIFVRQIFFLDEPFCRHCSGHCLGGEELDDSEEDSEEDSVEDSEEDSVEDSGEHTRFQDDLFAYDNADRLLSVVTKFRNLETVSIHCQYQPLEYEPRLKWLIKVLESVSDPQLHKVTPLELPIDTSVFLLACLVNDYTASVASLMRQIKHLSLDSGDGEEPILWGLNSLLKAAPNLVSLEIDGFCDVFDTTVSDFDFSQPLQLQSLELNYVTITSYELLGLLERCKDFIGNIRVRSVSLIVGTWLHVLTQIKKNLKLSNFFFFDWEISLEKGITYRDMWIGYGFFRRDYIPICHLLGEIQRQTNANRLAAGLEPQPKTKFRALDLRPLRSVMTKARYRKLSSQTWDAEKNDKFHYDSDSF